MSAETVPVSDETSATASHVTTLSATKGVSADEGAVSADSPGLGHNRGPLSAYEAIEVHIRDLYEEAKNWADGVPIQTEEQAESVSTLLRRLQEAARLADDERKREAAPYDEAKAEIQARYNLLIGNNNKVQGLTVKADSALRHLLGPWLKAKEVERERAAAQARAEAAAAAKAAQEAAREVANLDQVEAAEESYQDAKEAAARAKRLEDDRARVRGEGRAAKLKDHWVPKLVDGQAAVRHYWQTRRSDMERALMTLAQEEVRLSNKRQIPGFEIVNEPRVW
jgi:hypothetical protein